MGHQRQAGLSGQLRPDICREHQKNEEIADHRNILISGSVALGKMKNARNAIKYPGGNSDRQHETGMPSEAIPTTPVAKFATPSSRTSGSASPLYGGVRRSSSLESSGLRSE